MIMPPVLTHPDKLLWSEPPVTKEKFLHYLEHVWPAMRPFLTGRQLTVVRWPHGIDGPSFFQKNCPDYAPDFIRTSARDGTNYIVCDDARTLLWLGNQSALEYHIPFQKAEADRPEELVFDLDPPSRADFLLAVKAARELKRIFDQLGLGSVPKLTGSRGIQIHLPLGRSGLSYAETRLFASFVARAVVERFPADFTTERLKKNRGDRLYIDYVQHAPGKTVICPYSPRGKRGAPVAAPLFWEEVREGLAMADFTMDTVLRRLAAGINPFSDYFRLENASFSQIVTSLKQAQWQG
ncbi:MAG: non-homologous end-joining DNA ligase [Sporolactobacillus sp.]|jgi:bifunctional non-homologous end joining protein LigD|nr:non-homologous end-joining DNA ligase [Sporolactobacillus sp.]